MIRVHTRRALAALLLLPAALLAQTSATLAPAADPANPTPTLTRVAQPGGVALSPDGTLVAWTLRQHEGTTLHITTVADPDPAKEKLVTPSGATSCSNTAPVWSPDSTTLAYLSTCTGTKEEPGQEQVFLYSKTTGESRQLTHLKGNLQQLAWAPDGKSIAFLFVENATRSAGALDAMPPWDGVIGEDHVEIQRVAIAPVSSGKTNPLYDAPAENKKGDAQIDSSGSVWFATPADSHVYEFTWAPDSTHIAYIAAPPPGENTWWIAKLYRRMVEVKDAFILIQNHPDVVLDPVTVAGPLNKLQIAVPRYSPDGKQIAFIGGLMSDQGSTGGDIWVVPAKGGQPVDITPNIDGTPTYLAWTGNDSLGFVEDRRGHTLLTDYTVSSKKQDSSFDLGEVSLSGGAIKNAIGVSNRGLLAFVKSGFNAPPELFVMNGATNALTQLTHLNTGVKSASRTESIEWQNDGFHVQGWLTYPANYNPAKKYPLIVTVHGGPSASTGARFSGGDRGGANWSSLGYFELQPNPRGSFGQGEAFTAANIKDFGYGDLRDILAGVDAVEKKVNIDDHRLGLTGWSYGGFMSMFAETQTHRFAAIVAGAGISNWQSYYGENSIDQWMIPFFGASVYDDPAVYAKSSAITYIHQARTPMLIIVGDRDGECPAPQSFEMWHALKAEGVPTQLVIYPNEGHGFRDPAHIADRAKRTAVWFAKYMPAGGE